MCMLSAKGLEKNSMCFACVCVCVSMEREYENMISKCDSALKVVMGT